MVTNSIENHKKTSNEDAQEVLKKRTLPCIQIFGTYKQTTSSNE